MIEDLAARRRAAIAAREEGKAETDLDYEIDCLEQDFDDWLERERIKREKYEQTMAEKRRAGGLNE